MRCIGIIGAMDDEVAGLKEYMQDVKITRKASMDFYEGIYLLGSQLGLFTY